MNMDANTRKTNFELLRIISMFMIITYHLFIHGIVRIGYVTLEPDFWMQKNVFNKIFALFFFPGGEVGVGLFFMITGYFLYEKKRGHISKIVLRCFFYALISIIIILLVQCIGGGGESTRGF